jgi:putative SOS response-associated peptidase YedK
VGVGSDTSPFPRFNFGGTNKEHQKGRRGPDYPSLPTGVAAQTRHHQTFDTSVFVRRIRNTASRHWRGWLKPENRCLVPANSFAEYAPEPNPETKKKDVVWFALNDDRPLFAFGGIWTEFRGDRGTKSKPIPGPHLVYGFLTTGPNAVVEPIHPKAMISLDGTRGSAAVQTISCR